MNVNSFHPGVYLRELMIWRDLSPGELASAMQVPDREIVDLTCARRRIDRVTSQRLADYFGNSAQFWLDLQRGFDRHNRGHD